MDSIKKNRGSRRQPKQGRSRVLFDSICEACIRIIKSGRADQLSVSQIARTAGVTVSSFYQYFPNVDAAVGAALSKYNEEDLSRLNVEMQFIRLFGAACPPAAIDFLVDFLCDRHIRLFNKYGHLYQRYHRQFYLQRLPASQSEKNLKASDSEVLVKDIFEIGPNLINPSETDIFSFLTSIVIVDLLGKVVESSPQYLGSDIFRKMLKNMLSGYINKDYK